MEIHIDSEGEQTDIHISKDNIHVEDKEIEEIAQKKKKKKFLLNLATMLESVITGLVLITYVFVSIFMSEFRAPSGLNCWAIFWTLLFLVDVIPSIIRCVAYKSVSHFSIWGITLFTYLFLGLYFGYWHPHWVILLLIPCYYLIISPVNTFIKQNRS